MTTSAHELAASVRSGSRSARDVVEESLAAIGAGDADIHAFLQVTAERALERADAIDQAVAAGSDPGPLAGVPVALKDNLCTRGVPTTCSSRILEGWHPPYDATVVERLVQAGAVVVGKTNMDEFAMGSSTENSAFGTTRNPHRRYRVPGGSSGGSAAAVAAGFVPLALGSDTGGSIRQPAAFCGVVGMKPTYGVVSRYGLVAFASSLDQIGPISTTVADAALVLEVIGGHDPMDSTSLDAPAPAVVPSVARGVEGIRVGLVTELVDAVDPEVADRVRAAADALSAAGAKVDEISVPQFRYGLSAYYLIAPAEASSNLARFDGVRYGLRVDAPDVAAMNVATRTAGFGAEVKRRIMLGTYALSAGYYDAYYAKAQRVRTLVADGFEHAYARFDALLGATTPTTAFGIGEHSDDPLAMYLSDTCTVPASLAGHPALSVPFGVDGTGLPVGVQVMAPPLGEPMLFAVAGAIERGGRPDGAADMTEPGRPEGWEIVVGLEVHCELATATKLFCRCPNVFGREPNTNVCPVCLGLPGSLPVLNRQAVELAMRIGTALARRILPSIFHRKNYFYPDMPKDFQISQYDAPINRGGRLELPDGSIVGIERAHLEEDTGKTTHIGGTGRIGGADYALVDYNRAGVPLVEIVSAPDIRSAAQAKAYAGELRSILVATGASDGRMEEGSMRVDANVSVRRTGDAFGRRCEIKNLNSMRSLERAIEFEASRQVELVQNGERVVQETRHWDEHQGRTLTMRSKEEADDYRYFPEPDLVPVAPDRAWQARVADGLGPLPAARRAGLVALFDGNPSSAQVDQIRSVVASDLDALIIAATERGAPAAIALARAANEVAANADRAPFLDPDAFAQLVGLEAGGKLSATQSKEVLAELLERGGDPTEIVSAMGFESMDAATLSGVIEQVVAAHPAEWEKFAGGDNKVQGALIGKVMAATGGKANGGLVAAELARRRSAAAG